MTTTRHIIYDSEQAGPDQSSVWCFTLFTFKVSTSDPNWKTVATHTTPVYKDTITVFVEEVADAVGRTYIKPETGSL